MPNYTTRQADVKLNVAALKREKALLDKEEKIQAQKVQQMAMGLKDAGEFTRWQHEMVKKDQIEQIEHVQMKKIEMEMSREQAILAQEQNKEVNRQLADKVKKEVDELLNQREA